MANRKIYLFCSAGMSTSMLVKKMQEAAASPRNGEGENQAFSGRSGLEDNARSIRGSGFGQKSGFSGRDGFKNNSGTTRGNGFGQKEYEKG